MAQDETPYQTMEYNQLALQLFQMGFFRSDMAEQALRCLELMQFRSKDTLAEVIRQGQEGDGPEGVADGGAAAGGDAAGQEPGDPSGGGAGTRAGEAGEQRRKGGNAPKQRRGDAAAAGHAAGGTAQMIRASCGGAHLTVRGPRWVRGVQGRTSYARRRPRWCTRWRGDCGRQGGWNGSKSAPGYAEIAGTGDCAREFALVQCGLALLAQQYPGRVEVGS